jgi:DNA-binding NarL/FixJ family response regulator
LARGGAWFSPAIAERAVALAPGGPLATPTARELEVLTAVAKGWTDEQIAAELTIMKRTVRFHLDKVFARLGVDSRVTAVLKAIQLGWIEPPQT